MYVWIWRRLPGRNPLRVLQVVVLIAAVSALLLFVVFPFAEPRLPFDNVTINEGNNSAPSSAPSGAPSGGSTGASSGASAAASASAVLPGGS